VLSTNISLFQMQDVKFRPKKSVVISVITTGLKLAA
jgi:hypothetical protein